MRRSLEVVTPEGPSGTLVKEGQHVFSYSAKDRAAEVSLSMPIQAASYNQTTLHAQFAMNLPEGFLLDKLRRRLAKFGKVDDMLLLERTGRQQIGRLQYLSAPGEWSPPGAAASLQEMIDEGSTKGLFEHLVETYLESGVAGVQPKVLVPDAQWKGAEGDQTTVIQPDLIVKAAGDDLEGLAANEFACMSAARRAGIPTPEFWLSNDDSLFVMRRFDLQPSRRGFEDIAAVTGMERDPGGAYKYKGSYEAVAAVIATYAGARRAHALEKFFDYLVLSIIVRNGDAHLKNFGLTYSTTAANDVELAPLFDVVTTSVYSYPSQKTGESITDRTMALKLLRGPKSTTRYPARDEMIQFGRTVCGIDRPQDAIERIVAAVSDTIGRELLRVHEVIRASMANAWNEGLSSMGLGRSEPKKGPYAGAGYPKGAEAGG